MHRTFLVLGCALALGACAHGRDGTQVTTTRTPVTTSTVRTTSAEAPAAPAKSPAGVVPPEASPNEPAVVAETPAESARQREADRTIATKIRQAVVADESLAPAMENVQIVSKDGRVVLRGTVPSVGDRARLEAKARTVPGVVSVTNEIGIQR